MYPIENFDIFYYLLMIIYLRTHHTVIFAVRPLDIMYALSLRSYDELGYANESIYKGKIIVYRIPAGPDAYYFLTMHTFMHGIYIY